MAVMCGVVGRHVGLLSRLTDITDPHQREIASYRLVAKVPTRCGDGLRYSIGQPFIYPRNDLSYARTSST